MAINNGAPPDRLTRDRPEFKEFHNLLAKGQYKKLAALLLQLKATCQQNEDKVLADILAAACQICSACGQSRAEVAWHEHATQEAHQREQELKHELDDILGLISKQVVHEMEKMPLAVPPVSTIEVSLPEHVTPPLAKRPGLFQRIQGWVRGEGVPWLSRHIIPVTSRILGPSPGREAEGQISPALTVYCLGPFRVYLDDQLITNWSGGKGKVILKYLVTHRDHPVAKEILMDLFWPEANPEAARNNLNVAIYALRQAFRAIRPEISCILFQDDHYLLNPAITVWVDFEEFEQCYQAGRSLEKQGRVLEAIREYELAEGLYQGDFLEEDSYEDWPILRRESLKDRYLVILERLSRYYLEQKRYTTCIHLCHKILAKDDCREDAHRRLMRCYSGQGQRNLALRQYHFCVETLARVLDVSPMQETVALYHQIFRGETG